MLEGSGTRLLMTYSNGIRQPLLKNKPITCLEDIKGLKMRTAETLCMSTFGMHLAPARLHPPGVRHTPFFSREC